MASERESNTPVSVRGWVSRLLVWLAAFSAMASFALEEPLGSRLGSVAIGCAIAALLVWRGWKPAARDDVLLTLPAFDDSALADAAARIAACCDAHQSLDGALCDVARAMAQELGARHVRASRVQPAPGAARVATLLDLAPPGTRRARAIPRKGAPVQAVNQALERALRDGGVVSDPALGHAFAVPGAGSVVAVIDFEALELGVDAAALQRLLAAARTALAEVAARELAGGTGLPVFPPPGGDAAGFLASVTANRQVGLFVLEPQHQRLVAVSRCAERDFGVRRQRVLGKTVAQAFGAPIAQALQAPLADTLASSRILEQDLHWPSPRGQRGANLSVCVLRRADGSPQWLVAMARPLGLGAAGERRVMPRHGLLHDDAVPPRRAHLPRPAVATKRPEDSR